MTQSNMLTREECKKVSSSYPGCIRMGQESIGMGKRVYLENVAVPSCNKHFFQHLHGDDDWEPKQQH